MNPTALILPGIGNSGPDHWQTLWEKMHPSFTRVQQRDWERPVCEEWREVLEKAVAQAGADAVLVAHSLACILVARWAEKTNLMIKGALLVAPPDPEGPNFPENAAGFSPVPLTPFAFPSIVVASTNDPFGSIDYAECLAMAWGGRFVSMGAAGHINSQSGLGEWREGFSLFQQLAA